MKFLSTFRITKGFDSWLEMYKEIEPSLNELGIKVLWAGTNADETKVFDQDYMIENISVVYLQIILAAARLQKLLEEI